MREATNSKANPGKSQVEPEQNDEKRSAGVNHTGELVLNSKQLAAIGRVSSAIIQEFNNPLQAITNILAGIHRRGFLEPEDMPLVDLAYQEVIKLNQLVRELREFHQPTHGRTDLFDIGLELRRLIDVNRQRLSDEGISIVTEFFQGTPLIHAVSDQIRIVLQNLLDIAMESCSREDSIHISTSVDKSAITLQIRYCNCTINQAVAAQQPEPVDTPPSHPSEKELRLAKGYAIITMHGGTIDTNVDPEKDTTFKVRFPVNSLVDQVID